MRNIATFIAEIIDALNTSQGLRFSLLVLVLMSNVLAMEGTGQNIEMEGIYVNMVGPKRFFLCCRCKFKILLVFIPSTAYCNGLAMVRWLGLHEEMKLDIQRIWKRNLGRDDRCIADNGKEVRLYE